MIEIRTHHSRRATRHRQRHLSARIRWQHHLDPPEPECIEDVELFWMPRRRERLRPCSIEPTEAELDQIEQEMLEKDT